MLKIAHFGRFSPHASGQYETIRDLILAERASGMRAEFIDCGSDKKGTVREGLSDRGIDTVSADWALDNADIVIRHSAIPAAVEKKLPMILAMHGRPENSMRLETYGESPVISSIRKWAKSGKYKALFTFWREHILYWKWITGGKYISYVPAPVNFDEYRPDGEKHDFGEFTADLNIIVADIWREDRTPFNLIFAAQYFKERYFSNVKLHIFGMSNVKHKAFEFLGSLQRKGVVGQVSGVTKDLANIYRSADMILTPNTIATRIIRESMASGLPIIAPVGCPYTPYTADPRDYKTFAAEMFRCYEMTGPFSRRTIRLKAKKLFDGKRSASAIRRICNRVLEAREGGES